MASTDADSDGVVARLAAVSQQLEPLEARYQALLYERDELVGELLDAGWTQKRVGWIAHLTQPRVHQIAAARRNGGRSGDSVRKAGRVRQRGSEESEESEP